jgi:hypothetical protein
MANVMTDEFIRVRVWAFGEEMVSVRPVAPFVVDGITYTQHDSVDCPRPMVQILLDDDPFDSDEDRAQMFCSDPPTDTELDKFVYLNIEPSY